MRAVEAAGAALAASRGGAAGDGSTTSDSHHLSPEDVSMSAAVDAPRSPSVSASGDRFGGDYAWAPRDHFMDSQASA